MAKTLRAKGKSKINTKRFPGEMHKAYKKRMARNKRVRERRRQERAAKRAAKRAKTGSIPGTLSAPATRSKHLAVLLTGTRATLFVNGTELANSFDFEDNGEGQIDFVNALQSIALGLGSEFQVHDLRRSE
jgi:hypothetical protein